jgi:osmotically-inducible protein OsmY
VRNLLSALALVAVFTGLSQAASVAQPVPAAPRAAPKNNDAQIERTIKAKFAKSKINVEHFTISVQNGVATIEGKTNVIQHKGVATRLARTGGALAVQNHIQISEEAKAKAAARLAKYRNGETQIARATVIPARK